MKRTLIFFSLMPLAGVIPGMFLLTIVYHTWPAPEVAGLGAVIYLGGGFVVGLIPALVCGFGDWLFERKGIRYRAAWVGLLGACTGLFVTFHLPGILPLVAAFCCAVPAAVCSSLCSWLNHTNAQSRGWVSRP